jgi:hypothetical protein
LSYKGIEVEFESLKEWLEYFPSAPDLPTKIVKVTPTHG